MVRTSWHPAFKNGEVPERLAANPHVLAQKDLDARWTEKNDILQLRDGQGFTVISFFTVLIPGSKPSIVSMSFRSRSVAAVPEMVAVRSSMAR